MHTFSKPGLTAKGFTGERVWFMSTSDIFSGTSVEEAFLYYTVSGGKVTQDEGIYWCMCKIVCLAANWI